MGTEKVEPAGEFRLASGLFSTRSVFPRFMCSRAILELNMGTILLLCRLSTLAAVAFQILDSA
jgi:hypothetical protein